MAFVNCYLEIRVYFPLQLSDAAIVYFLLLFLTVFGTAVLEIRWSREFDPPNAPSDRSHHPVQAFLADQYRSPHFLCLAKYSFLFTESELFAEDSDSLCRAADISLEEWWRNEQFWVIGGTSAHLAAVLQVRGKLGSGSCSLQLLTESAFLQSSTRCPSGLVMKKTVCGPDRPSSRQMRGAPHRCPLCVPCCRVCSRCWRAWTPTSRSPRRTAGRTATSRSCTSSE
jgi:hypothetical protein